MSHPVSGGVSHFVFLSGDGGGVLWWSFSRMGRPSVSEVREEVGGCMCVCHGVGLTWVFCSGCLWRVDGSRRCVGGVYHWFRHRSLDRVCE